MKAKAIIVMMKALVEDITTVIGDTDEIVDIKLPEAVKEVLIKTIKSNMQPEEWGLFKNTKIDKIVSFLIREGSYVFGDAQQTEIFIISAKIL